MQDWCTCNSDGTSKENPGPSSIACCIRNEERDIQYAACRQLSDSTSIFAEAMAMTEGCEYCVENQFLPLFLKTDSLALMKMVKGEWESPWNTIMIIKRIRELIRGGAIQVQHTYREENALADFSANFRFSFAGTHTYRSFTELPRKAKGILIMDKQQIPQLRIRNVNEKASG